MFYIIAFVLFVLWLLGWLVFEVLGAVIHIVFAFAVAVFLVGLFKKTKRAM